MIYLTNYNNENYKLCVCNMLQKHTEDINEIRNVFVLQGQLSRNYFSS